MPETQKRIIHANIAVLIYGGIAAALLLLLPVDQCPDPRADPRNAPSPDANPREASFNNPLYPEFKKIAATEKIDLDFTRNVVSLSPRDPRLFEDSLSFPIFCNEKKSLDVILVGDSTLSWGVIPRVIQQMTGLRTGMFSFRSMYLNRRSLGMARRVIQYYLKDDGIAIFGFTIWTQLQSPDIFRRGELVQLEKMTDPEFEAFALRRAEECGSPSVPRKTSSIPDSDKNPAIAFFGKGGWPAGLYSSESYRLYRSWPQAWKRRGFPVGIGFREWKLAETVRGWLNPSWFENHLALPGAEIKQTADEAAPVAGATEPSPGPALSENQFQFLKWDGETFTLAGPFHRFSIASRSPSSEHIYFAPAQKINAQSLISIPGRKAFLITFYANDLSYVYQRTIYRKFYSGDLELIDLGLLHPGERGFPVDDEDHPVNTGGLQKSILIGKWLRENFAEKRRNR